MKNLLFSILLLLPLTAFTQNKKVSFAFEGSVGWADNIYTHDSSVPDAVVSQWREIENGSLAFDFGGLFNIQLNDKVEFQTGAKLLYSRLVIPKRELRWGSQHDGNGGWDENTEAEEDFTVIPSSIKLSTANYYIEFPARINLQLSGKLKTFKLSLGQSPTINFLNISKNVKYFDDRTERERVEDETANFRRLNFNTQVGFIWEKDLKKGNAFYVFPNVRTQTLGRAKSASLNRRYITFGISTGIYL